MDRILKSQAMLFKSTTCLAILKNESSCYGRNTEKTAFCHLCFYFNNFQTQSKQNCQVKICIISSFSLFIILSPGQQHSFTDSSSVTVVLNLEPNTGTLGMWWKCILDGTPDHHSLSHTNSTFISRGNLVWSVHFVSVQ